MNLSEACFNGCLLCVGDFDYSIDSYLTWSEGTWNEHLVVNELFVGGIIMGLLKNITVNICETFLSGVPSLSFVILGINHYFSIRVFVSDNLWVLNNHQEI